MAAEKIVPRGPSGEKNQGLSPPTVVPKGQQGRRRNQGEEQKKPGRPDLHSTSRSSHSRMT